MTQNDRNQATGNRLLINDYLFRRAVSAALLDERPERDIDRDCGYPIGDISMAAYQRMYDRNDVARRVVECLPNESWAVDPVVYETEDANETEFERVWSQLVARLNIFHYLQRVDELSGIGRFGILLLGFDDGMSLSESISGGDKSDPDGFDLDAPRQLLYLRPFSESEVTIQMREGDIRNPRYGLPTLYNVNFQEVNATGQMPGNLMTQSVHWSRVIHVADNRTVSEVYGIPRMQAVYNRLLDIRKILSSSAEMFWLGAFGGHALKVDPDIADQGVELNLEQIREAYLMYQNGIQRFLALNGMSAQSLSPQVVDPGGHLESQLRAVAVTMAIPYRILFGSEQAQLASGQDAKNWARRMKRRQQKYLEPMILRPFVDRLISVGVLPPPKETLVHWPDLEATTDGEKAQVAQSRTTTLAQYVSSGVDQLIPPEIFLTQFLDLDQNVVDSIMEEMEKRVQEEALLGDGMDSGGEPEEEEEEETTTLDGGPSVHYDPNQPRDPKGTSTGGQFADEGGGGGGQLVEKRVAKWVKDIKGLGIFYSIPSGILHSFVVKLVQRNPKVTDRGIEKFVERVQEYTGDEYLRINRNLRGGKNEKKTSEYVELISCLPQVKAGTKVYRGINTKSDRFSNLRKGQILVDQGFASTTRSRGIAKGFASDGGGKEVMFEIHDMSGIGRDISRFSQVPDEKEVVYLPGTRMKVTQVVENEDIPHRIFVTLEVLPPLNKEKPKANYDPNQPRDPKGTSTGGQFADESGVTGIPMGDLEKTKAQAKRRAEGVFEKAMSHGGTRLADVAVDILIRHPELSTDDLITHVEGLSYYVEDGYVDINTDLRVGRVSDEAKDVVAALDVLDPIEKGTVVFRGMRIEPSRIEDLESGKVITDRAFMSTTEEMAIARDFAKVRINDENLYDTDRISVMMEIEDSMGKGRRIPLCSAVTAAEKEVLFPPSTKLEIISREEKEMVYPGIEGGRETEGEVRRPYVLIKARIVG